MSARADIQKGRGRSVKIRAITIAAVAAMVSCASPSQAHAVSYKFDDEFSGKAGSPPSSVNWTPYTGPVYNNELETWNAGNCLQDGHGHLVITAKRIVHPDKTVTYTSCRLETRGHFAMTYGSWQARLKFCSSKGLWPAFWFEGTAAKWPQGGEIDVMEDYGRSKQDSHLHAALSPSDTTATWNLGSKQYQDNCSWHIYKMVHETSGFTFSVDGVMRWKVSSSAYNKNPATLAAFSNPDFVILNLSVGGNGVGNVVPPASEFPATLEVDYVRAW